MCAKNVRTAVHSSAINRRVLRKIPHACPGDASRRGCCMRAHTDYDIVFSLPNTCRAKLRWHRASTFSRSIMCHVSRSLQKGACDSYMGALRRYSAVIYRYRDRSCVCPLNNFFSSDRRKIKKKKIRRVPSDNDGEADSLGRKAPPPTETARRWIRGESSYPVQVGWRNWAGSRLCSYLDEPCLLCFLSRY